MIIVMEELFESLRIFIEKRKQEKLLEERGITSKKMVSINTAFNWWNKCKDTYITDIYPTFGDYCNYLIKNNYSLQ